MSDENKPVPDGGGPVIAILWLLLGLAPILILLAMVSYSGNNQMFGVSVLLFCAACNLAGGIGCLRNIKNVGARVILGIFLGVFFFVLSCGIALFQACSHSNF